MITLDAADPLVLDTRPLGRRAGAMIVIDRTLPAPAGWSVSNSHVVPGAPLELHLRLESVVEGVLVSGDATLSTGAECSRCLDPIRDAIHVGIQQLFEYEPREAFNQPNDDDPLPQLHGDLLDLRGVLREAVVLDLPQVPLCAQDCPGLCPTCGKRLAEDPTHHHAEADGRWAALQDWLGETDDLTPHEIEKKGD